MEVKVNVINEMKRLRENTYSDRYTWIDEVIQNCQRAKATHIDVTVEYDRIIVSDNGVGCTDPQILFDKSSSGWDEEVTATESPFGEGFFSTMMAADTITVSSVGFTATFDVNKMFAENKTDVIDIQPNKKRSGFTLTLTDLTSNTYRWDVIDRFKKVGKYIKSPTMTVNGERVHYEGLNPDSDSPFVRKVDTPYFKGWIEPRSWKNGDWGDINIKFFACSRHIKDSTKFHNVSGCLNIKENAVNLRRPDRKEFIFDEKYDEMCDALNEEIKKLYIKVAKEGDDASILNFEDDIRRYVSLDEYKNHIKFKFLTSQTVKMSNTTTDTATVNTNADNANDTDSDDMTFAAPAADDNYYDGNMDDSPINEISSAPIQTSADIAVVTRTATGSIAAKTESVSRRRVSAQTGIELDKNIKYAFYVACDEKDDYKEQIAIAQHYNIPVVEIRNRLEREIVENDDRFNPISEMQSLITLTAEFKNATPATMQEIRANQILSRIATACGARDDLFTICDTDFNKVINANGSEYIVEKVDSFATAYNGKIYINRSRMVAYKNLDYNGGDKLNNEDVKFILLNLETLAHEMSHALYGNEDQTMEHISCINTLMQKMINLIYGVDTKIYI